MGKSRRNRPRPNRSNPIAKPVKPPADPELAALRESKILPVLQDLKSPDLKSRTAAASAIANIVTDEKCRKLLLREQVVHIVLTETLTDNSIDSRAAGWEILRVLAEAEETDFCVHLFRLDVLTAISHAGRAVNETLTATEPSFAKLLKAQKRLVWDITASLLSLVRALAVARDEILEAIVADRTILRFIFRLVSIASIPPEVFEEALNCLMVLSEDSLAFGQAITGDQETGCYDELLKLKVAGGPRVALACGVLHNIFSSLQWLDHSPGKDAACDAMLVPSLSQALEHFPPGGGARTNGHDPSAYSGTVQVALEVLSSIATDLQTTLEKGNRAPFGAGKHGKQKNGFEDEHVADDADDADAMEVDSSDNDDDAADDKDASDREVSDDEDDELLDADMGRVTGADEGTSKDERLDELPTVRALILHAIPQLIRLTNINIENEQDMAIQALAFSALNNFAWTMSCIDFSNGENTDILAAWSPSASAIWRKAIAPVLEADNADLDLAMLVTSLAWAVARTLKGDTPSSGNPHRKFMALYESAKVQVVDGHANGGHEDCDCDGEDDPLQGLGVRCIGVLGCLARDPAPIEVNREVGVFLMMLLAQADTPVADVIEALDQVYDIYGDEDAACNKEVFYKDGFLKRLQELQPRLKTMAKGIDKRKQKELRNKADEAALNLGRFISYMTKHAPR